MSDAENRTAHEKNARNEELERERAKLAEEALNANKREGMPEGNPFDAFVADGPIDSDNEDKKDN